MAPPAADWSRVRVRTLPLWMLAGLLVAAALDGGAILPGDAIGDHARETAGMWALYLAMGGWAWHACRRAGTSLRGLVGPRPSDPADWRLLAVVIPLIPLSIGAVWLLWLPISYVAPGLVRSWVLAVEAPDVQRGAPIASAFALLLSVVVGPAVEEIVYRGVMLRRWALRWGVGTAALLSATLFGLQHGDVLGSVVFGLVMTALHVRTRVLWLSIAAHVLNNGTAAVAELLDDGVSDSIGQFQREWWIGAVALLAGAALLWAMRRQLLPPAGWRLPPVVGVAATRMPK